MIDIHVNSIMIFSIFHHEQCTPILKTYHNNIARHKAHTIFRYLIQNLSNDDIAIIRTHYRLQNSNEKYKRFTRGIY